MLKPYDAGHGKEFGFYSKGVENPLKVLSRKWYDLIYILADHPTLL